MEVSFFKESAQEHLNARSSRIRLCDFNFLCVFILQQLYEFFVSSTYLHDSITLPWAFLGLAPSLLFVPIYRDQVRDESMTGAVAWDEYVAGLRTALQPLVTQLRLEWGR